MAFHLEHTDSRDIALIWNTIVKLRRHMLRAEPVGCISIIGSEHRDVGFVNDSVPENTDILLILAESEGDPEPDPAEYVSVRSSSDKDVPTVFWVRTAFDIHKLTPDEKRFKALDVGSGIEFELVNYLSYALLPYFSKKQRRCYVISHFAQTLDGRIASSTGDSRWIGNQENLIHAHRMRALCDGILIGANTSRVDRPSLTVRHVEGDDPTRIVIGKTNDCDGMLSAAGSRLIQLTPELLQELVDADDSLNVTKQADSLSCKSVLDFLYRQQIHSIYIEGGSRTTSSFIEQGAIDQLQIHFAPLIIGSGKTGFQFSGIEEIKHALTFGQSRYFQVGGQMMFVGEPHTASNGVQ